MNEYSDHQIGDVRYRRFVIRFDDGFIAFVQYVIL